MFNDKITKKIAESAREVLEANNEEVPPVVMGRLPDSALPKKKVTRKAIPIKKPDNTGKIIKGEAPLVQTGQGDYTKKVMPSDKAMTPIRLSDVKNRIRKFFGR